ncbi:lipopolysaccharide biosynthesis protein [Erythrobacter colymbi]|uniref:lipopolysaccharide biosynthesis protein n=1 Tax=Erythrobacter colymbi TaxID=1161202 RepID=UPI000A3AAFF9|nr:hypothetical protein [Erythrobacter colymbi]
MFIAQRVISPRIKLLFDLLIGLFMRGGGAVASFIVTWLIARQFGAGVVGQYQIGLTTATLGAVLATLGLHLVLIREAGRLITSGAYGDLAATYMACRRYMLVAGIAFCTIVLGGAAILEETGIAPSSTIPFVFIFAPLIAILAWMRLNNDLLRSLGDVWRSQLLEGVFYSGLTAIVLLVLWLGNVTYPPALIAAIYVASAVLALFFSSRIMTGHLATWGDGVPQIGKWQGLVAVAPNVILTAADWTVLLIVGAFLSIEDAGVYRTLVMYSALIVMISTSFDIMAGPHLAKARANHDRKQFFSSVNSASALGLLVASPLVLIAVFFPSPVLSLFGPDFVRGATALGILSVAQLIRVVVGPAAPAMVMLHKEKPVLYIEIIAALASIPLALVLVQHLGLMGPPIAVLTASILRGTYTRWALARAWPASD